MHTDNWRTLSGSFENRSALVYGYADALGMKCYRKVFHHVRLTYPAKN